MTVQCVARLQNNYNIYSHFLVFYLDWLVRGVLKLVVPT